MHKLRQTLSHLYMGAFLIYLIIPLVIMAGAAFNDSKLPSIVPWRGWTLRWFHDLFQDERMWVALFNTLVVALAVAVIAIIIGTAAAILINSISGRIRTVIYGLMISTILIPGAVIRIEKIIRP